MGVGLVPSTADALGSSSRTQPGGVAVGGTRRTGIRGALGRVGRIAALRAHPAHHRVPSVAHALRHRLGVLDRGVAVDLAGGALGGALRGGVVPIPARQTALRLGGRAHVGVVGAGRAQDRIRHTLEAVGTGRTRQRIGRLRRAVKSGRARRLDAIDAVASGRTAIALPAA